MTPDQLKKNQSTLMAIKDDGGVDESIVIPPKGANKTKYPYHPRLKDQTKKELEELCG